MSKLVIAEKPSVAKSIADVLGAGNREDGYLEGNGYIVSWCVGHLVELKSPEGYDAGLKKWNYESLPIVPEPFEFEIKKDTRKQFQILKKLMHDKEVTEVICATDAGREGELIFRLLVKQAGCKKPIERLWISSMEESAIKEGFANLRPGSEYENLYASALCRQQADWLVGINGTRLFTVLYKGKVLKVGRVQTPTLAMLVDRECAIANFKKEPYYNVAIFVEGVKALSEKIADKRQAEALASLCQGKAAYVSKVSKEEKQTVCPKLYDLTTLQRDANRIFGMTAKQTLEAAQSLYEKKLCTYPRTDSRYLSEDMEETAKNVIWTIREAMPHFCIADGYLPNVKVILNSKKVTDHHAIIPTMEIAKWRETSLNEREVKILSLVSLRFLCATSSKHRYETQTVEFDCEGNVFKVSSKKVMEEGFKAYEKAFRRHFKDSIEDTEEESETDIGFSEGAGHSVECTEVKESFTKPPKHFTEDSLLAAMEKAGASDMDDDVERKGLGTPATRADVIEKLVKDGFVRREKKKLVPTDDGMKLITILPDVLKTPKLTADWENDLVLVAKGKKSANSFMKDIIRMVEDLVGQYSGIKKENAEMFSQTKKLGVCPKCGGDILYGKYGAYCNHKCGMNVSVAYGKKLTEKQIESILSGKKILLKGLKSKQGTIYDAYITPNGVKAYSYMDKKGENHEGFQYDFVMEFPKRK